MKKGTTIFVLLLIIVGIVIFPLLTIKDSEFGGADGEAEGIITEINPEYEPWAESLIEPPGGETESLLFSLQSAFGAGIIGLGFGYFIGRKKHSEES
jgi:cobalt/nickel transport protein